MLKQLGLGLAAAALLLGCATTGKYEAKLNSWKGHDISSLMQAWGPPSNQYALPNGSHMYTWLWVGGTRVVSAPIGDYRVTTANTAWCKTTMTANGDGIITQWRWEGNDCKSR